MRETDRDPLRLTHIKNAINDLLELVKDVDLERIPEKDLRYYGIVKLLEIIGEASFMLTKEFVNSHPDTPWNQIIKMRHILVHGYYTVNPVFVKSTVKENLQPLLIQINKYLEEIKQEGGDSLSSQKLIRVG